jgi:hypothetical protein
LMISLRQSAPGQLANAAQTASPSMSSSIKQNHIQLFNIRKLCCLAATHEPRQLNLVVQKKQRDGHPRQAPLNSSPRNSCSTASSNPRALRRPHTSSTVLNSILASDIAAAHKAR